MDIDLESQKLAEKIQAFKKSSKIDLSLEEDLSMAIMNLISLEEHFFFTSQKTGKAEYLDLLNETRQIRKQLMAKMIDQHEGETWCVSKHLLAATMRLVEVGTKYLSEGKDKEAKETFASAYKIYSLFWALRIKLVNTSGLKKINDDQLNIHDKNPTSGPWKVEDIVNKLVDCCNE